MVWTVLGYLIAFLLLLLTLYLYKNQKKANKTIQSLNEAINNQKDSPLDEEKIKLLDEKTRKKIEEAQKKADEIIQRANKNIVERQESLIKIEKSLLEREKILEEKILKLSEKEKNIDKEYSEIEKIKSEIKKREDSILSKLEEISKLSKDEAKNLLLNDLKSRLENDFAVEIKQYRDKLEKEKDRLAQEIIVDSMTSAATDYVGEYTTSIFHVGGEEIKGRIIGKEGRNIKTFQKITGVDLILDESDEYIVISCFDPLRRELAKIALTKLLKDGRINPARIEEVVDKARVELSKQVIRDGEEIAQKAGFNNLSLDALRYLGRMKYRFSYGQCLATHVLEVVNFVAKAAAELKLNVQLAKECALWHDIGKVETHEKEGDHMQLGEQIGLKLGLKPEVINAMYAHHMARDPICMESALVYIADANSAARPGARYGTDEDYVKRIKTIEDIARAYEGVKEAYAIEAGRELRVFVDPVLTTDDAIILMADRLASELREKVQYSGIIKVTVIREVRAVSTTK